uniref:Uncharacterized protein n=1 Tax=Corvus moneduloides TaxID=1196302 RepID=A0A8C3GUL3_CORMO
LSGVSCMITFFTLIFLFVGRVLMWSLLSASDRGAYTCKASNKFGADICQAEMVIIDKPHFIKNLQSVQSVDPSYLLTPGDSAPLLECKVSGSPPISVAWFHNGLKLVSGEKHQISFSDNLCILEVNSLSHSETGTYTCKATNTAGSDECSAVLINLRTLLLTWNLLRCQLGLTQHCNATLLEHQKLLCLGTKAIQNSGLPLNTKCSLKTMLLHLFSTKWLATTVENISARQKTV